MCGGSLPGCAKTVAPFPVQRRLVHYQGHARLSLPISQVFSFLFVQLPYAKFASLGRALLVIGVPAPMCAGLQNNHLQNNKSPIPSMLCGAAYGAKGQMMESPEQQGRWVQERKACPPGQKAGAAGVCRKHQACCPQFGVSSLLYKVDCGSAIRPCSWSGSRSHRQNSRQCLP